MNNHPEFYEVTENQKVELTARAASETDSPDLIKSLVDAVNQLIPEAGSSAGKFLRGWGDQSVAKAAQIKATVIQRLAEVELNRQKLIEQRDVAIRTAELSGEAGKFEHQQKMYALRTQRLKDAVESICRLRDIDAVVDVKVVKTLAEEILKAAQEQPVE